MLVHLRDPPQHSQRCGEDDWEKFLSSSLDEALTIFFFAFLKKVLFRAGGQEVGILCQKLMDEGF